jgi:hypothetical protein
VNRLAAERRKRDARTSQMAGCDLVGTKRGYVPLIQARAVLRKLEAIKRKSYVSPWRLALVYLGIRDNDRVFFWLERALSEHSADLIALRVESIYDPLRNDPRFADLIERVGLP